MKKVALDLDGVVFDSENLYRVYTEIYDIEKNKKDTIINNNEKLFQKRYNWTKEEINNFYTENANKILKESNIMPGADIVLNKLKDKYEFIIVTSRNDLETEIAKEKLNAIGMSNIKIFNNEHNKIDRLIKEKVDYVIDDDSSICINAANNNIYALYFKNNACNKVNKDKVVNINNWGEIYKYLILNNIKLIIIKEKIDNYKLIYKWCKQKYIYEWFEQRMLSYEEIVDKYKNKLSSKQQQLFFISYNQKKVGFVQIYKYKDKINKKIKKYNNIYEYDIFIGEEDYLSKGICNKIVNYINNYIYMNYKCDCIVLRPSKRNIRAIKCYQKNKFNIIDEYQDYDTIGNIDNFIVMIKEKN